MSIDIRELIDLAEELEGRREDGTFSLQDQEQLTDINKFESNLGCSLVEARDIYFIEESEFEDYCRELASDCGYLSTKSTLDDYIDWQRWAEDCQGDYQSVEWQWQIETSL